METEIPPLRLQFPDDLSDVLASMGLAQHTRRQISDCLQKWFCSTSELQTKKFQQTCQELLPLLPKDDARRTIESLRFAYENVYVKEIVPRVRSHILAVKRSSSSNEVPKTSFNAVRDILIPGIMFSKSSSKKFVPVLEEFFASNAYPSAKERAKLARKSKMTPRQIEVWVSIPSDLLAIYQYRLLVSESSSTG